MSLGEWTWSGALAISKARRVASSEAARQGWRGEAEQAKQLQLDAEIAKQLLASKENEWVG